MGSTSPCSGLQLQELRDEANAEKACFVRYSFQTFGLTAVWLGLLIRYQPEHFAIGFSGFFIAALCVAVGRLGIYKYASANRINGVELHVGRLNQLDDSELLRHTLSIPWEVLMKAWRVVQPTIFEKIYHTNRNSKYGFLSFFFPIKEGFIEERHADKKESFWFLPERIVAKAGALYFGGSYLRTMLSLHMVFAGLGIVAALLGLVQYYFLGAPLPGQESAEQVVDPNVAVALPLACVWLAAAASVYLRFRFLWNRQIKLESELLSIHSCAVTWHAVCAAHLAALSDLGASPNMRVKSLDGYLGRLSHHAQLAAERVDKIHDWIDGVYRGLEARPSTA